MGVLYQLLWAPDEGRGRDGVYVSFPLQLLEVVVWRGQQAGREAKATKTRDKCPGVSLLKLPNPEMMERATGA